MKKSHLIAIGAMVLISIAVLIRSLLFLHPTPGDGGIHLRVRFQNIDKLAKGSKVKFAGKPVGEVEKVVMIEDAFNGRPKDGKRIFPYELTLSIDSSVKIYETDTITAKTAGLLGERSIEIIPQSRYGKELVPVSRDTILYAQEQGNVEDALKKVDLAFDSVLGMIQQNQESVYQTTTALGSASKALDTFLLDANSSSLIPEMAAAAREAKTMLQSINMGTGTLGRLMHNPQLYEKTDFFIDSISSYGLFFHTNPAWQRSRIAMERKSVGREASESAKAETILHDMDLILDDVSQNSSPESAPLLKELREKIAELKTELKTLATP